MDTLTFRTFKGSFIASVFDDLAALRISVFRDFPYLYEGSLDYEREYLKTYAQSERSFLFAVYDGPHMVGATTCIPLENETPEVKKPFEENGIDLSTVFYFGESLLLPSYRGKGLGHRFFDEREAHAKSFGTFTTTCFCSVTRPENHLAKPENYRPNDAFWTKRGYHKEPSLVCEMEWQDIGEPSPTSKRLVYWLKTI